MNEEDKTEQIFSENSNPPEQVTSKQKKKKNPFITFLLAILYIFLGFILAGGIWFVYSAIDKKSPLELIPENFVAYLHTDSLYDSVNPLLDLQAADIVLSKEELSDIRGLFMMLRESDLRDNKFVKYAVTRKVDAAFFSSEDAPDTFVAAIDFGVFSAATRLSNLIVPKLAIEGLSHIQESGIDFFKFTSGENSFYIKPVKNLVVISNNFDFFKKSLACDNDKNYSEQQLNLLSKKTKESIKLIVDAKSLAQSFTKENDLLYKFTSVISEDSLSLLSFNITDNQIKINVEIPLNENEEIKNDPALYSILKLFQKDSTNPEIISVMGNSIQYYTVLNAGKLEDLLDAVNAAMPEEKKIDGTIKTAENLCQSFFGISLDDLLFSWTDKEFALLGIEGLNEPVFAIKISDENKRKEVFDTIVKSILLTENKSLILNGVRIPRLELPPFLQGVLKLFNFNIPKPYYLVYNNYIYFSQSAESIATIYSTFSRGTNISLNQNWKAVSENNDQAAVSLFYDLERSRPFFINSSSTLSQIIELYTIGRTDISIKNNSILFSLNAVSKRAGSLINIPGFPIELENTPDYNVQTCQVKKPETIFWLENEQTIKALNVKKTQSYSYELPVKGMIQTISNGSTEKLAALTKNNEFYIFTNTLEIEKGYPLKFEGSVTGKPYFTFNKSYIPLQDGNLIKIDDKKISKINFGFLNFDDSNLEYFFNGTNGVIYERSFLGKIYIIQNEKCINIDNEIIVDKIGFGVPAIYNEDDKFIIGFISQSGEVTVWKVENNFIEQSFQFNLEGIFYSNLIQCGKNFYALSDKGELFKINSSTGETVSVQIDNITAIEGKLAVRKVNDRNYICAGIDGNKIYAFNEQLELISGFPIAAHGIPAFADVNGDSLPDCFALTIDGKLNAWNLR